MGRGHISLVFRKDDLKTFIDVCIDLFYPENDADLDGLACAVLDEDEPSAERQQPVHEITDNVGSRVRRADGVLGDPCKRDLPDDFSRYHDIRVPDPAVHQDDEPHSTERHGDRGDGRPVHLEVDETGIPQQSRQYRYVILDGDQGDQQCDGTADQKDDPCRCGVEVHGDSHGCEQKAHHEDDAHCPFADHSGHDRVEHTEQEADQDEQPVLDELVVRDETEGFGLNHDSIS